MIIGTIKKRNPSKRMLSFVGSKLYVDVFPNNKKIKDISLIMRIVERD